MICFTARGLPGRSSRDTTARFEILQSPQCMRTCCGLEGRAPLASGRLLFRCRVVQENESPKLRCRQHIRPAIGIDIANGDLQTESRFLVD
jgi:hypothetical protein